MRTSVRINLLLGAGLLVFSFAAAFYRISGADIGFHIRTGAHILETGRIPAVNTFSFTRPEHPWLLQQWWPGILFCTVWRGTGVAGLIVLKALIVAVTFGLALAAARAETGPEGRAWPYWAATAGVCLARLRFLVRPFLFSALCFALLLCFDRRYGRRKGWQWAGVPLLMAVWANTHAGVLYGFLLLALWTAAACLDGPAEERMRAVSVRGIGLLLAAALSAVTLEWINPNGFRVILVPVAYFGDPFWQSAIKEFQPLVWRHHKPFYLSVLVLAVLQGASWRRPRWRLALPALVLAVMSMRSQRCVLFYALAMIPYAAYMLSRLSAGGLKARTAAVALLPPVWLVAAVFFLRDPTYRFGVGVYAGYHPEGMFRFMRETVALQNVFNHMRYGAGMLWRLYPDFRPFIDGRCEAYGKAFWRDVYLPAARGEPVWRDVFARYGVTGALLTLRHGPVGGRLARALHADPDWALVAFDDETLLFLKRTEQNAPAIAAHAFRILWPPDRTLAAVTPENAGAARREARRALAAAPGSVKARTALARACLLEGDYAAAAQAYERVIRGARRTGAAYRRDYGYALFMAGRWREADAVFSAMIRNGDGAGFPFYMRHHAALAADKPDAARTWLEAALEREPDNAVYRAARERLREAGERP
ncbi:MAG: tetratricopeptide repeat protein [Lentisphaerae bacterium]|nr:tetratricopeptide repeat protein [Lentisphaerota bacterium]